MSRNLLLCISFRRWHATQGLQCLQVHIEQIAHTAKLEETQHRGDRLRNDGSQRRAFHAHPGKSQMTEDQQKVQPGVEQIDTQTDVHGHLGLMDGPIHKSESADGAVEIFDSITSDNEKKLALIKKEEKFLIYLKNYKI